MCISLQPELISSLKRTADVIFDKGGFLRTLNNLGNRELPYRISSKGLVHKQGHFFTFEFDVPPQHLEDIAEEYSRDVDIVRKRIFNIDKAEEPLQCTLHEEMQPPAYRKDVQELIAIAERKKPKKRFNYNSGLDYYPFQK